MACHFLRKVLPLSLRLAAILLLHCGTTAQIAVYTNPPPGAHSNRILVKPMSGADLEPLRASFKLILGKVFSSLGNVHVFEVPPGADYEAIFTALQSSPGVERVERDYYITLYSMPNLISFSFTSPTESVLSTKLLPGNRLKLCWTVVDPSAVYTIETRGTAPLDEWKPLGGFSNLANTNNVVLDIASPSAALFRLKITSPVPAPTP